MSERVIAIQGRSFAGARDIVLKPDPEAPSVAEVVEVLRRFVDFHEGECDIGADEGCEGCKLYRDASNLIARLEGA